MRGKRGGGVYTANCVLVLAVAALVAEINPMPPQPKNPSAMKPPVTVLCGFLGAGKTTLLNHLLSQAEGRRWAAVVNDVAAINIDAAVVRSASGPGGDVVELGNGCVCCSSRDELGETVAELASSGKYEHILVETTGVAEPRGIAALFLQKNSFGRSLNDFAQLSALVSVVDSAQFLREWREHGAPGAKRQTLTGGIRPVFELMLEQIECADVLLLNKVDLIDEAEREEIESIVRGLNAKAEIVATERSQIASEFLLDRVRFDPAATLGAATWIQKLNTVSGAKPNVPLVKRAPESSIGNKGGVIRPWGRHAHHEERYGIASTVYQARRPFDRGKLEAVIANGLPGLLRAKGYLWVADQPDEMGFLSVAGGIVRYAFLNYWWAAQVENGKASRSEVPPQLEGVWQEPHGDRRQELVFIGVGLDEMKWRKQLDDCLV